MRKAILNVEKFNERAREWNMLTHVVSAIVEKYESKEFYINEEESFELFGVKVYNLDGFGISNYELEFIDEIKCDDCNSTMIKIETDYPCQYCDAENNCINCSMDRMTCINEVYYCKKCDSYELV